MTTITDEGGGASVSIAAAYFDLEAEQSVLGGLLLDNGAWDRVGDMLRPEDFFRRSHQLIFEIIARQINALKPCDIITVAEAAKGLHDGFKNEITMGYLNQLSASVPSAANIRRYAEIVRTCSLRRNMSHTLESGIARLRDNETPDVVIEEVQAQMDMLGASFSGDDIVDIQGDVIALLDELSDKDSEGETGLVSTGFDDLDEALGGGLEGGDLIVLGGRPSMGKTALAMDITEGSIESTGKPAVIFSLEMTRARLVRRTVAKRARVSSKKLRSAKLSGDEWSRVAEGVELLSRLPIFIADKPAASLQYMRAKCRAIRRKHGKLALVMVDYIGLMGGSQEKNRNLQLGEYSRGLKTLAKELGCPVLVLAQLNRGVESRADKRPLLSDLRDSGEIEQDADVVMFVHRQEYYDPIPRWKGYAEVLIRKQRDGEVCDVPLHFEAVHTAFSKWGGEKIEYERQDLTRGKRGGGSKPDNDLNF